MIQNDEGMQLDLLNPIPNMEENVLDLNYKKNFNLTEDNKCLICFKGDEHLGSKYHDINLHKKMINWILSNPNMYVILMGDALETATKDSVGAGIFEQDSLVQEQLDIFVDLHKDLAKENRILGIHVGNHEFRVYKHSGLNLTKILVSQLNHYSPDPIKYLDHGILHYFQIGNQNYTLYTTHGGSGASNITGKLKAVMDLEKVVDADLYAMGHTHGLGHVSEKRYTVDKKKRKIIEREKFFLNTGSYLSYWGSYAQMKGYTVQKKGSPVVEFGGTEKRIKIFLP